MAGILDTANKKVGYITFDLTAGEASTPVVVRVVASDAVLLSEQSDDVMLKARRHGTSDPYVDLATNPIDLSGFTPGSNVDFDLVCEADGGITGLVRVGMFLGVVTSGPAAWAA